MKTINYKLILSYLAVLVMLISCGEEPKFSNNEVEATRKKSMDVFTVDYAQKYLGIMGKAVLLSSRDAYTRRFIYSEVDLKFDGDHNVLIKKIDENNKGYSNLLGSFLQKSDTKATVAEVTYAFNNVDGMNYYPQIYIPYYDELKEKSILGLKSPVVIVHAGQELTSYKGFTLDDKGEVVEVGGLIDENYAKSNEVWVVAINERVDNEGKPYEVYTKNKIASKTPVPIARDNGMIIINAPAPSGRTKAVRTGVFEWIRLITLKESWAAGGSEVNVTGRATWGNGYAPNTTQIQVNDINIERRVTDVPRNQLGDWRYINWAFWPGLETDLYGQFYCFTLYEYDAPPASLKFAYQEVPLTYTMELVYRSSDGPWDTNRYDMQGLGGSTHRSCCEIDYDAWVY